jgi:hypothetical protein
MLSRWQLTRVLARDCLPGPAQTSRPTCRELQSSATRTTLVAPLACSWGNKGLTRTTTLMLSSSAAWSCAGCSAWTQRGRHGKRRELSSAHSAQTASKGAASAHAGAVAHLADR